MLNWIYKSFEDLTNLELYQSLQLRNEVFVVEQDCVYQDADGRDIQSKHLLGYDGVELAAYVRIVPPGISYAEYCSIGRVVVSPLHRRKEYGKAVMQKAIDICKEEFEYQIKISAQCYLEKFYTELGFKVVSEQYLEDDIPHYAMIYAP
jgi:ElaA protein